MHKVHGHFWHELEGRLSKHVRQFATFVEAKEWAENSGFHSFTVFDEIEQVVHSDSSNTPLPSTYA